MDEPNTYDAGRRVKCVHCGKLTPLPENRHVEDLGMQIKLSDAEKRALRLAFHGALRRCGEKSVYWTINGAPVETMDEYNSAHTRVVNKLVRLRLLQSEHKGSYLNAAGRKVQYLYRSITKRGLQRLEGKAST